MKMPENFSTALLALYLANLREEGLGDSAFDLEIETANGKKKVGDLFRLEETAEVWMCADLCALIRHWGSVPTPEDIKNYGGMKPDICWTDKHNILFIENKTRGGRREYQEKTYLAFLGETVGQRSKKAGFVYCVPERLAKGPDSEWTDFLSEGDQVVLRGLLKWDRTLVDLLGKRLGLPDWFSDKLPDRY